MTISFFIQRDVTKHQKNLPPNRWQWTFLTTHYKYSFFSLPTDLIFCLSIIVIVSIFNSYFNIYIFSWCIVFISGSFSGAKYSRCKKFTLIRIWGAFLYNILWSAEMQNENLKVSGGKIKWIAYEFEIVIRYLISRDEYFPYLFSKITF